MVLGVLIIAYPFIPSLTYLLTPKGAPQYPYPTRLAELPDPGVKPLIVTAPQSPDAPTENRLVIPKIGVNVEIVEGNGESALLRGAWRIPSTSNSPDIGNMVVSAHRFRYRPPSSETFYLLDKLERDDVFIVYWQGKEYDYKVTDIRVVNPSAVEILEPTPTPQITLFTCTPLFSTAQRLVVVGEPIVWQES